MYNPATGIGLVENRRALQQYLSNLDLLCPVKEWEVENRQTRDDIHLRTAGGVIATVVNESVQLFTLGSSSRRIPYKEWKIPHLVVIIENYGFCPGADIIAFVELEEKMYVYWLSKMLLRAHLNVTVVWNSSFI